MADDKQQKKFGYQIDMSDGNAWDDTLLIKAYDESLLLAKEAVAKKLAKATNKKTVINEKKDKSIPTPGSSTINDSKYVEGDYVRATYTDGVDYEARILKVIDDGNTCLIRYVGYENEEFVKTADLIPSWGKKARKVQKKESQKDKAARNHSQPVDSSFDEGSTDDSEDLSNSGSKSRHGKRSHFSAPMFSQNSTQNMPVPPPPPMPPMLEDAEDAENLSAMLMSWYMSGYYTGLYQGQRMARKRSNYN